MIELEAPLPADYDSAINEICALRRKLINTNRRWATSVEKSELTIRSLKGSLKALRLELLKAKGG